MRRGYPGPKRPQIPPQGPGLPERQDRYCQQKAQRGDHLPQGRPALCRCGKPCFTSVKQMYSTHTT